MNSATMSDNDAVDPDDELLVAYLDGELDAQTESELMNRLMDEQELNRRLQRLQEGWEWLDELPDATPSEKLVESTLELVVADIVKAKPPTNSPWSKYRWELGIAGACLFGILASLLAVAVIKSNEYSQQLRDLVLAENLDAYLYGGDMKLMRLIASDPAWAQTIAASRELGELQPMTPTISAQTPIEDRAEMLAKLALEDRAGLASRWERFSRLDESNAQRIRQTALAVAQQPDAEELLKTMQIYAVWRENLPTELRDQIEGADAKKQREAIDKAIEITQSKNMRLSRNQLDDETVEWIYYALRQILQQRLDDGDVATIKHVENSRNRWGEEDYEPFAIFGIVGLQRFPRGRSTSMGPRPGGDWPASLRQDELELIRLILPDSATDILEVISESGKIEDSLVLRSLTLRNWAEEAARRKLPYRGREEVSLLDRYNELSTSERERIDLLPPNEMINRIAPRSRFP